MTENNHQAIQDPSNDVESIDVDSWGDRSEGRGELQLMSRSTYLREAALKNLFLLCAFVAVMGVVLIIAFVITIQTLMRATRLLPVDR